MLFYVRQLSIKRNIERCSANSFSVSPIIVQLFKAVKCCRFKIQMEFVSEQFRATGQLRQVANAKDANSSNALSTTLPVERPIAPVLESCYKSVLVSIGLRLTYNAHVSKHSIKVCTFVSPHITTHRVVCTSCNASSTEPKMSNFLNIWIRKGGALGVFRTSSAKQGPHT